MVVTYSKRESDAARHLPVLGQHVAPTGRDQAPTTVDPPRVHEPGTTLAEQRVLRHVERRIVVLAADGRGEVPVVQSLRMLSERGQHRLTHARHGLLLDG